MIRRTCLFVLPLALLLGSCNKSTTPTQRLLLREARITPGSGVDGLKLGMPVAAVLLHFGPAKAYWNSAGYHLDYPDLGVYALAVAAGAGEGSTADPAQLPITSIACGTPDAGDGAPFWGRTTSDIAIGSLSTLVERAYGPAPLHDRLTLSYPQRGIRFALQEDHVVRIIIFPPVPTTAPSEPRP